jgi:hypothetical protein
MRDAVQTARGALVGDVTDIMMTTREEQQVMASIARLDAQLHSTAAHRYSKGTVACTSAVNQLTRCRRCRGPFVHCETLLHKGCFPQLSAQCRV